MVVRQLNACTCAHIFLIKSFIYPSLRVRYLRITVSASSEDHPRTSAHVRTPSKHYHYHLECITTIIKLHATRLEYAAVHRAVLGDALPLKIIQEVEYTNLRSADRKGGSCDTPPAPSSCPTARHGQGKIQS